MKPRLTFMTKMIEPDLQIIVKGVEEDLAADIGNAVSMAINGFSETDQELDFRRMHRVVVTTDMAAELRELSQYTASGRPITHTEEVYATAVAKVMLLPRGDGIEILPLVNAGTLLSLVLKDEYLDEEGDQERLRSVIHYLHHEFCHVHDDNKKIDAFPGDMLRTRLTGKDMFTQPLADSCWSEYIADFLSSETATATAIADMTGALTDAIRRTKRQIDKEILSYRYHADLDRLVDVFQRHGEFLARAAAYVMGYMDGMEKSLRELSPDAAEALSGSYFEETWEKMYAALTEMRRTYPEGWGDLGVYDELSAVMEDYYGKMGLILSDRDGGAYIDVPFRPETTPGLLSLFTSLGGNAREEKS